MFHVNTNETSVAAVNLAKPQVQGSSPDSQPTRLTQPLASTDETSVAVVELGSDPNFPPKPPKQKPGPSRKLGSDPNFTTAVDVSTELASGCFKRVGWESGDDPWTWGFAKFTAAMDVSLVLT